MSEKIRHEILLDSFTLGWLEFTKVEALRSSCCCPVPCKTSLDIGSEHRKTSMNQWRMKDAKRILETPPRHSSNCTQIKNILRPSIGKRHTHTRRWVAGEKHQECQLRRPYMSPAGTTYPWHMTCAEWLIRESLPLRSDLRTAFMPPIIEAAALRTGVSSKPASKLSRPIQTPKHKAHEHVKHFETKCVLSWVHFSIDSLTDSSHSLIHALAAAFLESRISCLFG